MAHVRRRAPAHLEGLVSERQRPGDAWSLDELIEDWRTQIVADENSGDGSDFGKGAAAAYRQVLRDIEEARGMRRESPKPKDWSGTVHEAQIIEAAHVLRRFGVFDHAKSDSENCMKAKNEMGAALDGDARHGQTAKRAPSAPNASYTAQSYTPEDHARARAFFRNYEAFSPDGRGQARYPTPEQLDHVTKHLAATFAAVRAEASPTPGQAEDWVLAWCERYVRPHFDNTCDGLTKSDCVETIAEALRCLLDAKELLGGPGPSEPRPSQDHLDYEHGCWVGDGSDRVCEDGTKGCARVHRLAVVVLNDGLYHNAPHPPPYVHVVETSGNGDTPAQAVPLADRSPGESALSSRATALLDALVRAATQENERAVAQALRGERDPHTSALWETCFRHAFEKVLRDAEKGSAT